MSVFHELPPSPSPSVDPNMVPAEPRSPLVDLANKVAGWFADRPWLAVLLALVVVVVVAAIHTARAAVWRWRHRRLTTHAHQILITPPPEVDAAGAAAWWANLHDLLSPSWRRRLLYGVPHIAVEYRWSGRQLTIVVWVPGTVPAGPVAAAVRAAWPGAACTIDEVTEPIPGDPSESRAVGGALAPALPAWYPLNVDHDTDPMRPLVAAGAGLHTTEAACVQVLARPATRGRSPGCARAPRRCALESRPAAGCSIPSRCFAAA